MADILQMEIYVSTRLYGPNIQEIVKYFQEMIESLRDSLVHILHTRDGARVAMQCVWHGTAKVGTSRI